jgi:hypothetical protein
MNSPGKNLEQRARELYREASQHVDPATVARLRAARREALASARAPKHHSSRWLIPVGAFAMLGFAALMVWQPPSQRAVTQPPHAIAAETGVDLDNDLPPDAEQTDPNLYQDLDFYGWLAANNSQQTSR